MCSSRHNVLEELSRIVAGCLKKHLEILVTRLLVKALVPPLRNRLSVEDENVEKRVEKQDDIRCDRRRVQQNLANEQCVGQRKRQHQHHDVLGVWPQSDG